jgi:predicted esterase|tara:strand:+ start:523 stop:1191 length:669 start_codon:yes stop_codon:yes gene_type:complete
MNTSHPKENQYSGPHQNQPLYLAGADPSVAKAAMIMVHGRGDSAQGILRLANEIIHASKLLLLAPQAFGNTWYPYSFLKPTHQNQPGLDSGLQAVNNAVQNAVERGIPTDKIFILGFSQGACLASEYVARHARKYAGLMVLSGGLIGESIHPETYSGHLGGTSVFMGCSDVDFHIPVERVHESEKVLSLLGGRVTKNIYPGMGHTINQDEIDHINSMVSEIL